MVVHQQQLFGSRNTRLMMAIKLSLQQKGSRKGLITPGCSLKYLSLNSVRWRPIVICTSSIADEQQLILESAKSCGKRLNNLQCQSFYFADYSVRAQWTADCTHLVTSQVKSSIKTIVALQSGAHIVSVEWLKQYIDHAKRIRTLTDTEPLPDFFEPDPAK
jgi:hypothetical protein